MTQSTPKRIGQCAFCGLEKPITRDHIPPKALFPDPKPQDLITVPCCEGCRAGWSDDDEYFRFIVISSCAELGDERVERVNQTLLRSFKKETKAGFAAMVRESLRQIEIMSPGGIYLRDAGGIAVEKRRIDRVADRILRGLFWHEKRYPVPAEYEVMNRVRQEGLDALLESLGDAPYVEHRTIGNGMFAYTFASTEEDPDSMVWLSLFFDRLPFAGFTVKPKHLRRTGA